MTKTQVEITELEEKLKQADIKNEHRPAGQQKFSSFIGSLSFFLLIWAPQVEAGIPPMSKEQIVRYVETIRNDPDPEARLKAVIALHENYIYGRIWIEVAKRGGELYHTNYITELVQLFEGEMDFNVKLALGIFCTKMGDRTAVPFLISALEQETYPKLGYDKTPLSFEGGTGDVSYTQWHILRALQTSGDGRANAVLTKLYEGTKKEMAIAQSEADRSSRLALLGLVARAMVSTGATQAIEVLVKELQADVKGEELKCEEVLLRAVALGSKRALESLEVRQVLLTLLRKSPCEQVREFVAGALGSVRDDPQVRQILLEASYNDAVLSVRKSAVVALWHEPNEPYVEPYIKQLNQETDPQRQQRLLNDYRSLQENWGPSPKESLQKFQAIQEDFVNKKIRESISEILDVEREKALISYENQLDYRDKGYGTYPDYVRAGYLDSIRLFLPFLSFKEIERIQTLSQRETNPELLKALLNLLEEHQMLQKTKEQ